MKQYEIWWAELPRPGGCSPVLWLRRDDACEVLNKIVAPQRARRPRADNRSGVEALLEDLKSRGLLQGALVVCSTEFGRPTGQRLHSQYFDRRVPVHSERRRLQTGCSLVDTIILRDQIIWQG